MVHALPGDAELKGGVMLGEAPEIDLLEDPKLLVSKFAHEPCLIKAISRVGLFLIPKVDKMTALKNIKASNN